ncbi:hypothetical protein ACIQYS_15775 [Psychrobacillus sp. NPDC096426]|uniref:hypothetical protein n=1 Tax=Psychrobacillus sp. NPDC096426 TaxID=3364491 RepID=UPI00382BCA77
MKNKLIIISTLIVLCLIGFQYWITLQIQTELPSNQWSRSFPVDTVESNFSKLQSVPAENGYTVSLLDFQKLIVLSCNMDLDCVEKRTIDTLNTYANSWSDETNSYYIKDNSLIHWNSSDGEKTIAQSVIDFAKTEDTLVYWTDDQNIIVLNSPYSAEERHYNTTEAVKIVRIIDNQIFVVTKNEKTELFTLYNLSKQPTQLFQFDVKAQEILSSLQIIQQTATNYLLLLDKKVSAGGSNTKNIEIASFNLSMHQSPIFNKLSFVENQTGLLLKNIQTPTIFQGKQGPIITFSSTFDDSSGENVTKIFVGDFSETIIQAHAVTKSGSRYERPILLNEQTVAYLKMNDINRSLAYSSADEAKKQASSGIMEGDYKAAFYTLIEKLFYGFLLVLFSIVWIIIALLLTYGTLIIMLKKRLAHSHRIAFLVHIVALLVIQMYFLFNFSSIDNFISHIPFIKEYWHFAILLLFSSILSTVPLYMLREKVSEDNFNVFVVYSTFMNLIVLFLLIGPYLF